MTGLIFYDAAFPPEVPPRTDGVAFYIGGNTPHVWTAHEIFSQRARYRLPIYVRNHPVAQNVIHDVSDAVGHLQHIGAPKGCLVAWDSETSVDPHYMLGVFQHLQLAGYTLIDYGSPSTLFGNKVPDGYYWGADWTGRAHIHPGEIGTQFFSSRGWDLSEFRLGLPFWDVKTRGVAKFINWQEEMMQQLPVIRKGAIGSDVRTVQALCTARGHATKLDGVFGDDTEACVRSVQTDVQITVDGIVGPQTWPALMGIA